VKRWLKRIISLSAIALLAGGIIYTFMPKPVDVDVGRVTRGVLQVSVEEDGKTRIRDRYVVSAPLGGRLQRLRWRAGDRIARGQPLAVIEPTDPVLLDARTIAQSEARVKAAKATVEQTAASLERARTMLEYAETELTRSTQLSKKQATSEQELVEKSMTKRMRDDELRQAAHAQDVANYELELAQAALLRSRPGLNGSIDASHFEVPAPPLSSSSREMYVLRVFQESETVATPGMQLLEIGDPSNLEVEIDVLSSDAVKIRPGARVVLEQWGGDYPLEARVRLVEPSGFLKISALGVEEQRVNVIADFASPEEVPDTLRDAYRVEARIIVWEADDCVKVPNSALFRTGEDWAVFQVLNERAERKSVEIGRRSALEAQVLSGLQEGDVVIVHPTDRVHDGVRIQPR
jgi:HlyD family secretion protein